MNWRDPTHFDSEDDYRTVNVNNSSPTGPIQDYVHPDDQTQPTFELLVCLFID